MRPTMPEGPPFARLRFADYQADVRAGELFRSGKKVFLQEKPFEALALLLERAGDFVSRQELTQRLWPGVFIAEDQSLNTAMHKLRLALRDHPEHPRFVQTIGHRGYKFIHAVEQAAVRIDALGEVAAPAHEAYLQGLHFWKRRTGAALQKAINHFLEAISMQPNFALPYAWLAHSYVQLGFFGVVRPEEAFERAITFASRALGLNPRLGEGHAALARAAMCLHGKAETAEDGFRRARQLSPQHGPGYEGHALLLLARGRTHEAIAEMQHARELDPASGPVQAMLAYTLYLARQYGPALEWVEKSLDLDFRFPMAHAIAGEIELQKQGCERAVAHFSHACQLSGGNAQACALLAYGHALAGDEVAARAILADLEARSRSGYVPRYFLALVHIGLREHQQALDCLTLACRERCQHRLLLGLDPKLDPLKGYGRFGELIASCALGEVATATATP